MRLIMHALVGTSMVAAAALLTANTAHAHCDTVDGPVVVQAKSALEQKDITPVLKWIKPEHEKELKTAFARTLAVRPASKQAQELADQFFFETLVRLHRQGEGAPYTGLKPAGTQVEPTIQASDKALEVGNVDALVNNLTHAAADGIRDRFAKAAGTKPHAEHNVKAGREYVAAYVEFVHYVEALHTAAARPATGHTHSPSMSDQTAANPHEHNH